MALYFQVIISFCFILAAECFFFQRNNRKVDCLVTNWSPWSSPNEDGQRIRTCRILRMPANGGRQCPHIQEVKDEGCNCTIWSGWSNSFGFGQKSRTRQWLQSASASRVQTTFGTSDCKKSLEEDIRYTGIKPTFLEVSYKLARTLNIVTTHSSAYDAHGAYDTVPNEQISKVRDIVLILDSSGSITKTRFDQAKRDTKTLFSLMCPKDTPFDVNRYNPYQHHQLAMLTFSTTVKEIFNFNTHDKTSSVLNAITKAKYIGGATNTAGAFRKAKEMFQKRRGARESLDKVKREVLILTDGMSNTGGNAIAAAKELSKVADVYGLMIGEFSPAGKTEVTQYVSKPASQHLFNVEDFDELSELVAAIKKLKKDDSNWQCQSFDLK